MSRLFLQMRWQFVILHRNNLIWISVLLTIMYAAIFYFIKNLPNVDKFLVLLIFNDPALIGLFFMGIGVILEKNTSVLTALMVTPINHHNYLIARILDLSLIGWACAAGMTVAMIGTNIGWPSFSVGVFSTCIIFSITGIYIVSYTSVFLSFILRSIPVLLLLSLPLLNYFQLTQIEVFNFTPIYGPLQLIIKGIEGGDGASWPLYIATTIWVLLLYFFAYHRFVKRIVKEVT